MEKERKLIDFTDVRQLVTYGNDVVLETTRLCNDFEKRAVYINNDNETFEMTEDEENKIDTLNLELDKLIEKGQINLDAYHYDVEYYKVQSLVLETVYLKQQYLVHKTRYDIFESRLKYLREIKKELEYTKKRFKAMALKFKKN